MAALSLLYAATVFRNDPHLLSLQNKLKMTSLSTDWIENEHFLLVFMKTSVFMPKTGSINSGTGICLDVSCVYFMYLAHPREK